MDETGEVHGADVVNTRHPGPRCRRDKAEVEAARQLVLLEGTELLILDEIFACEDHGEDIEETNNVGAGEVRHLKIIVVEGNEVVETKQNTYHVEDTGKRMQNRCAKQF